MAPFNPGAFQNCAFFTGAQEIGAFWPPDLFFFPLAPMYSGCRGKVKKTECIFSLPPSPLFSLISTCSKQFSDIRQRDSADFEGFFLGFRCQEISSFKAPLTSLILDKHVNKIAEYFIRLVLFYIKN